MEMIPVESKALKAVGYDADRKVLRVEFPNGALWDYSGVPQENADDLMRAPSQGKYFAQAIKPNYPATQATPSDEPNRPTVRSFVVVNLDGTVTHVADPGPRKRSEMFCSYVGLWDSGNCVIDAIKARVIVGDTSLVDGTPPNARLADRCGTVLFGRVGFDEQAGGVDIMGFEPAEAIKVIESLKRISTPAALNGKAR